MVYKKEVVGERVELKLSLKGGLPDYLTGKIHKINMQRDQVTGQETEMHNIIFDDGTHGWFNLTREEEKGRLHWMQKKKRKTKEEVEVPVIEIKDDEDDDEVPVARKHETKKQRRTEKQVEGVDIPMPDVMQSSIDAIIRYMDLLEPTKGYFERQKENRNGCSKTRKKLRDYANKNSKDLAVAHYKQSGGKWEPPTHEALIAMIKLLKKMIK